MIVWRLSQRAKVVNPPALFEGIFVGYRLRGWPKVLRFPENVGLRWMRPLRAIRRAAARRVFRRNGGIKHARETMQRCEAIMHVCDSTKECVWKQLKASSQKGNESFARFDGSLRVFLLPNQLYLWWARLITGSHGKQPLCTRWEDAWRGVCE